MLQITKGECQFLFDLLQEINNGVADLMYLRVCDEVEQGIELLDEILKREDENEHL